MTDVDVPERRAGELVIPAALGEPHLADTSVWSKVQHHAALADWFNAEVRALRIRTCDIVVLELLRSSRNHALFEKQAELLRALDACPVGIAEIRRAHEVQALLAARGRHRGIPPSDLLIAASAEAAGVPVLHDDRDYDLIGEVTGQSTRWVSPAGSLP